MQQHLSACVARSVARTWQARGTDHNPGSAYSLWRAGITHIEKLTAAWRFLDFWEPSERADVTSYARDWHRPVRRCGWRRPIAFAFREYAGEESNGRAENR